MLNISDGGGGGGITRGAESGSYTSRREFDLVAVHQISAFQPDSVGSPRGRVALN